jgi:hypothetical protein
MDVTPFAIDDAYITFSFSKNLARGAGPVYGGGSGLRVEGYSNFLWMVLVAVPLAFFRNAEPLLLARIVTVPFAAALLASTYLLARCRGRPALALGATLVLSVSTNVILAFESGLETIPYVALITSGFLLYVLGDSDERAKRWSIMVFSAAALMRIDGFAPLGYVILTEAATARVARRPLRTVMKWALPGVMPWMAWFLWRWTYYGLPLPSTYYAKALIPALLPRRGAEYILDEVASSALYLAIPAYVFLIWRRHRPALLVGTFAFLQLAYAAHVGGDWMPSGRFVLPAVPLLATVMAWALDVLHSDCGLPGRLAATPASVAAFALIARHVEPHLSKDPYILDKLSLASDQTRHVASLKQAARYLAAVVPVDGRLVTDYGGVIAYFTQATPIEMWGLCNATIATRGNAAGVNPIYGRTCPSCYPDLQPEYFHTMQPLVRAPDAFARHQDVVRAVWQTDTIGQYMDIIGGFVSGRVVDVRNHRAVWFLERRRAGASVRARHISDEFRVEYPFVPGGLAED